MDESKTVDAPKGSLYRKVMVLNKSWKPVGIVSISRAVNLLFSTNKGTNDPKAKVIDPEDFMQYTWDDWSKMIPKDGEDILPTSHKAFRVPIVIILTRSEERPAG